MKKIYQICLFLTSALTQSQDIQICPGIPIQCQFRMNQWAEYRLLPQLRNFNLKLKDRISKLPNLIQRASKVKFQQEMNLDAEDIIIKLTNPTQYAKYFNIIKNDPERNIKLEEILGEIQEIINAYYMVSQEETLTNLEPLNKALNKNAPLLKKAEEELSQSQKANFNVLAPAVPPACQDFLVDPRIICAGTAATLPSTIWFDLTSVQYTSDAETKTLNQNVDQPSEESFNNVIQAPTAATYKTATEIDQKA